MGRYEGLHEREKESKALCGQIEASQTAQTVSNHSYLPTQRVTSSCEKDRDTERHRKGILWYIIMKWSVSHVKWWFARTKLVPKLCLAQGSLKSTGGQNVVYFIDVNMTDMNAEEQKSCSSLEPQHFLTQQAGQKKILAALWQLCFWKGKEMLTSLLFVTRYVCISHI